MNKLLLLPLLLFSLSLSLQAQYFGIRGGYNFTDAQLDISGLELETGNQGNLMLGLFIDLPIGTDLISIQPELNYLGRGYDYELQVGQTTIETQLAYLDLGALLKLNFGSDAPLGFYLGAGPFFNYAISGTLIESGDDREIDFDADRLRRGEVSVAGVVGITLGGSTQLFIEGRYLASLSDLSDDESIRISQNSIGINGGFRVPLF